MTSNGNLDLCGRWQLEHSSLVPLTGAEVSSAGFIPRGWHAAEVPTTVLNALVHAGVYPDPRYGLDNYRIPDASDEFNTEHDLARFSHLPDRRNPWKDPWWFRREFDAPADCGMRRRLVFNALNYRADVWLNGQLVAGRERVVGAFRRFVLDVTEKLRPGQRNVLAVCVFPPDHPGVPKAQLEPFQTPRAHVTGIENDLQKDVCINLAAVGYDCAPTVRDRLMGIWQEVLLEWGGPVRIVDPFVRTALPLPDLAPASLTVTAELANDGSAPVEGVFVAELEGRMLRKPVSLEAKAVVRVELSAREYPELDLGEPRLWWPSGYGAQELYELRTRFVVNGKESDRRVTRFGVRQVTKELHEADGEHGLRVLVNGRRIYCRGGYLQADTLLDWVMLGPDRWGPELEYLARANLNTVSFEDLPNLPESLMELADRHGIMIWNCFFQCHWLTRDDHPADHDLLEACAADIVRRARNHPSIVIYMCMNEGTTHESQYLRWRRQVEELDGTRILVPSGYGDWDGRDRRTHRWPAWIVPDTPVGANDLAPKSYGWQDPVWFYRNVRDDRSWMFKIESGSASVPPPESLKRFLPDLSSDPSSLAFPLNTLWANHGANSYYKPFHEALCRRHGLPASVEDYWWKAVAVSFEEHRAMFEAVNHRLWELTSGFMQWKLNACWPTIQWQIYDYFLRPTASYYAIRKACAKVVVQLSPLGNTVAVVNTTGQPLEGLTLKARIFDAGMKRRSSKTVRCRAEAEACTPILELGRLEHTGGLAFVRLELADETGNRLADNIYWRDTRGAENDRNAYLRLWSVPRATLEGSWRVSGSPGGSGTAELQFSNTSRALALLTRARLLGDAGGEEILPVYWSDNYVCVPPGERVELRAELSLPPDPAALQLVVDGWNTERTVLARA